jgi:integrase
VEARAARAEYRQLLAAGMDPQHARLKEDARLLDTLESVAAAWHQVKRAKVSDDYADDIWRSLELHVLPDLGGMPIHQVTAPAAIGVLRPLESKGNLETLRRVVARLNEVMTYAVNVGLVPHNTLSGIGDAFHAPGQDNQPTLPPEQLPELMRRIQGASVSAVTRNLILWQLHTMVRPGEAVMARWEDINRKDRLWTIPGKFMKSGKVHVVPLSDQVMSILDDMEPASGARAYVFPGVKDPTTHLNKQTANMAIRRMGYKGRLVAHGLRSLATTACIDLGGFDDWLVDKCLAHTESKTGGTTKSFQAYCKATYVEKRKPVMVWWSNHIEAALVEGITGKAKRGLKVVA